MTWIFSQRKTLSVYIIACLYKQKNRDEKEGKIKFSQMKEINYNGKMENKNVYFAQNHIVLHKTQFSVVIHYCG